MQDMGERARAASRAIALASIETKNAALHAIAAGIRARVDDVLSANARDLAGMRQRDVTVAYQERATLNPDRVEAIAQVVEAIAALPDPVGDEMAAWERPNGLKISRVRTPLGVIGIIFESRPNVTVDAAALAMKSGNASILRGGSDTIETNQTLYGAIAEGLESAGLPADVVQLVPITDRAAVGALLTGLNGTVDVIVPRGGKSLVGRVQNEARVPVFSHLEGICHIYVDKAADLAMATEIVVNAKMRRTSICGAAETLLIDRAAAEAFTAPLVKALQDAGCEVRGDEAVRALAEGAKPASTEDWSTEYGDAIITVGIVDGVDGALDHIATYGSSHTESIVTENEAVAAKFLNECDSAIVMHNASTQFADGGEFGMGAEIGIATGRMHARGPVGLEQLTSFHYVVRGQGQVRPA
ncbi:MAG: glutamate-5-semialdehyde dehydrogenase [Rhizobiales bacterium]|nr:glutamate-5-semialdehyde dehydrogenase [Hyphomicrobiales bacterium]MBO6699667.1 glutamate-5-semialdehyde dehydrogenase [Hyphomicrobiales bacterium]MBO6737205.1 glutamate-5-semialdehyde dehydrogenase [Hyphomicrobiales bacterium]MBO6911721.1 glutamate-5-semialdehyde dehydrogenase [Hyphomicrobiales bacterium]MBO6954857.1 glutamate-5-semialdehyde dehydrogenase [Hyphomicrobiales bacterium]